MRRGRNKSIVPQPRNEDISSSNEYSAYPWLGDDEDEYDGWVDGWMV
jgi:hypothetical protein